MVVFAVTLFHSCQASQYRNVAPDDRTSEPSCVKCFYNALSLLVSLVAPNVRYGFMLFVITLAVGRLHDDMKLENLD